jgi:hypothetical protein
MMSHPRIWFERISQIPRGSLNEAKIAEFLVEFANDHHLSAIRDDMNNVLIRKSGQHGGENAPSVLLQGHTDMVCEKAPDSTHDFTKIPLNSSRKTDGCEPIIRPWELTMDLRWRICLPYLKMSKSSIRRWNVCLRQQKKSVC